MVIAKRNALPWLWCSVVVILADQLTKWWAVRTLLLGPLNVMPVLNFRLAFNRGAAFSFLSTSSGWQVIFFSVLALLVSVLLIVWLMRTPVQDTLKALALCLLIGGALGNMIDRLRFGYVVDFIDFHIGSWHYATFNVADMAICVGAFLLVIQLTFRER